MLVTSIFFFSHYVFFKINSNFLIQINFFMYKCFQFENFVVWLRVNLLFVVAFDSDNSKIFLSIIELRVLITSHPNNVAAMQMNVSLPRISKLLDIPFPNKPWSLRVCSTSLLKTVRKGEIAHNKQFLLFLQFFLPIWRTFSYFNQM